MLHKQQRSQPQKEASTADGGGDAAAVHTKRECHAAGVWEVGEGVPQ